MTAGRSYGLFGALANSFCLECVEPTVCESVVPSTAGGARVKVSVSVRIKLPIEGAVIKFHSAENAEIPSCEPEVGRNVALRASRTARISAFIRLCPPGSFNSLFPILFQHELMCVITSDLDLYF